MANAVECHITINGEPLCSAASYLLGEAFGCRYASLGVARIHAARLRVRMDSTTKIVVVRGGCPVYESI